MHYWAQVDWVHVLQQVLKETMPVAVVLVCAALAGFGIGRLIRGRSPR